MANLADLNLNNQLYRTDTSTSGDSYTPNSLNGDSSGSGGGSVETDPANLTSGEWLGDVYIVDGFLRSKNYVSTIAGWTINADGSVEFESGYFRGDITGASGTFSGSITASSGNIGGFTITSTELYGGIIKTAATVGAGNTGVIMDTDGLRGYDSVLGKVFDIHTDGSAPEFASGNISNSIFEINTNAILRTSATVGDGSSSSAGILINDTGLYATEANQTLVNANVKILIDGSAVIKMNVKGGQTDFATGTGYFLGLSGGDYKLSVGSDTSYLRWNGTQMILRGSFDVGESGLINNAVYTVATLPIAPTSIGFEVPSANENGTIPFTNPANIYASDNTYATITGLNTGAISPGTMADDASVGTVAWTTPDNAKVSDNVYATTTAPLNGFTHYLKATNFGFSIPTGATINGILIEVEQKNTFGGSRTIVDSEVKIVKSDGTIGTTNKASASLWSTSDTYASYGSSSDLWGETWDDTKINNVDFGVVMNATTGDASGGVCAGAIDHIRITVYYTYTGLTVEISKDAGANWSAPQTVTFTSSDTLQTVGAGATELFGMALTRADMVDAKFYIRLTQGNISQVYKTFGFATGTDILTGIEIAIEGKYADGGGATNTSATSPGTLADDATIGTVAWSNPGYAMVHDGEYAEATGGAEQAPDYSHYLKATNFGFSIPSGATITGITVEIERKANASGITQFSKDVNVKIVKADGSIGSTNKANTATKWPTTDTYISYGSSSDLWGETWDDTKINDIDFGVVVSASLITDGSPTTASVDHVRITVYYTPPDMFLDLLEVKIYYGSSILPVQAGSQAFASNGRKAGEGAGAGTGLLTYYDGTNWIASDTGATVVA